MEVSKISANQDRKATALCLIFAAQASNFYHSFYNALDILKRRLVNGKYFFKSKSTIGFSPAIWRQKG